MAAPPDPQRGGLPAYSPDHPRLTEAQRRHLAITLGLVQQQLRAVETALTLPAAQEGLVTQVEDLPTAFRQDAAEIIARINQQVTALAGQFDLPRREGSRLRWVRAILGILWSDLEDARAARLRGYGNVDPALAGVLDPSIEMLQMELRSLERLLESGGA
jgi:hypothetical protein